MGTIATNCEGSKGRFGCFIGPERTFFVRSFILGGFGQNENQNSEVIPAESDRFKFILIYSAISSKGRMLEEITGIWGECFSSEWI